MKAAHAPIVRRGILAAILVAAILVGPGALDADPGPGIGSSWLASTPPAMAPSTSSRWFDEPPPPIGSSTRRADRWRGWERGARTEPTAYDRLIREAAERHRLEYALVKAMIQAESDFDPRAVSPKGACGLMQLMPATARRHGVRNVFLPRENVEGGCRYLRWLLDRYDGNVSLAVAAYNAGEARVDAAGGVPRIAETREYLDRVLRYRVGYLGQQ